VRLFGWVHAGLLLAIVLAAALLAFRSRQQRLPWSRVRLVLGYGLAANELIWWIFRYSHEGIHLTNLPLQLCDVTLWVTILACLTAAPLAIEVAYFAGMAGSGMALLTPDLWSPWPSYPAVYFFLAHGGVATASAVLVFGRIQPLRTGALWRSYALLTAYTMVLGAFNGVVGANYMYLCRKPRNPSLLDWLARGRSISPVRPGWGSFCSGCCGFRSVCARLLAGKPEAEVKADRKQNREHD
jgi:hypothetical integral membrane protein (TIGR02206 family)